MSHAFTLKITSALLPSFEVTTWGWAFLGGLLISLVNTILTTLLDIDNSESFYSNLVLRQAEDVDADAGRGVVMLEIDGLSYWHIQKAVEDGYMPTIKKLIDEGGYEISRTDCGVPSSTPACQAGILQGNNETMPAFRWMDKETNRIIAGCPQMAEVETRGRDQPAVAAQIAPADVICQHKYDVWLVSPGVTCSFRMI